MIVPIVARGQTIGILTLGRGSRDRFDEHDLDLAQELAGRAGVAMENARLVGELRRRAQASQALEFVGDGVFLVGRDGRSCSGTPLPRGSPGIEEDEVVGAQASSVLAPGRSDRAAAAELPVEGPTASCGSRSQRPSSPTAPSTRSAT